MKQKFINEVVQEMLGCINNAQLQRLQQTLEYALFDKEIVISSNVQEDTSEDLLESFLSAKRVEGCSEKSLVYYRNTIQSMLDTMTMPVREIETDNLREYLTSYQKEKNSSKVTIDNIRRILSSFFSWLEDEDYIIKSPVRRIHRVKSATTIKETYSDENMEIMRDSCTELRDLALIDILASTGMRIGELVLLNRKDINFEERECVVFGKGSKD